MDRLHVRGRTGGQGPYRWTGSGEGGQESPLTRRGQPQPVTTLKQKQNLSLITGGTLNSIKRQNERGMRKLFKFHQAAVGQKPDWLLRFCGIGREDRTLGCIRTVENSLEESR